MHERVVDERTTHLEHAQLVGACDRLPVELDAEAMTAPLGEQAELLGQRPGDSAEVDWLAAHVHPAGIQS